MAEKSTKAQKKEQADVEKEYKKPKIPRWGDSLAQIEALEKEYFKKHGKPAPPGTFKKPKSEKKGVFSGYKAMEKYSEEYWKQKELKKKIKKKKAEGAAIRAKKRK
jgi:hypothetical protein